MAGKSIISLPTAILQALVNAATTFRDGLKSALDSIDQNHAAYAALQEQFNTAQAQLADLQQHMADEETLADEPDLQAQITGLIPPPPEGDGTGQEAGAGA